MLKVLKVLFLSSFVGISLSGCEQITFWFLDNDPAVASSCAAFFDEFDPEEGAMCVECNSSSNPTAKAKYCGSELSLRCNSDLGHEVYGIAVGGSEGGEGSYLSGTAWVDEDDDGADDDDLALCHQQAAEALGKQEVKCTNALKGNGKLATTFEAEIKYDPTKDNCDV